MDMHVSHIKFSENEWFTNFLEKWQWVEPEKLFGAQSSIFAQKGVRWNEEKKISGISNVLQ